MQIEQYFNQNIIFPRRSFIGFIYYDSPVLELRVTLRKNGETYIYEGVTKEMMELIFKSKNKGSFITIHLFNTPLKFRKGNCVPMSFMQQISIPKPMAEFLAR